MKRVAGEPERKRRAKPERAMRVALMTEQRGIREALIHSIQAVRVKETRGLVTDLVMQGCWVETGEDFMDLYISQYRICSQNTRFTKGVFKALRAKSLGFRPVAVRPRFAA